MPNEETIVLQIDERPATQAVDRANRALRTTESTANEVGRSIGNTFDAITRGTIKVAEAVGALTIAFGSIKGAVALMGLKTAEVAGQQASAFDRVLGTVRALRLELSPTIFTAFTIAAGIATEAAIKLAVARKALYDQEALSAARANLSFDTTNTLGILQRQGAKGISSAFAGLGIMQIRAYAEEFEDIEDPVERASRAVELFKDKAGDALPLLNSELKDNIDSAYELSIAIDKGTRVSLQHMSDDLRSMATPFQALKDDIRDLIETSKNKIVVTVALGYETVRNEAQKEIGDWGWLFEQLGYEPKEPVPSLLETRQSMEGPGGAIMQALARRGGFRQEFDEDSSAEILQAARNAARSGFVSGVTVTPLGGMFESQMTGTRAFGNSLPMQLESVNKSLATYTEQYTHMLETGVVPPPDWDRAIQGLQARKKALEKSEAFAHSVDELIAQTDKSVVSWLFGKLYVTSPLEKELSEQSSKFFAGAEKTYTQTTLPEQIQNKPPEAFDLLNLQRMMVASYLPQRHGPGYVSPDALAGLRGITSDREKENSLQLNFLNQELEMQERLVKLTWGEDARDGVTAIYNLRISYADKEFQINRQTMGDLLAGYKELEQIDKARIAAQEQMAAIQYKQKESIARPTESLLNTLFTHPQNFGRALSGTLREATLRPITAGLAGMVAEAGAPILYGPGGQGGIAGVMHGLFSNSGSDPAKISTDMNTNATVENSARLANLTAIISSSGGGGGAVSAPGSFGGGGAGLSMIGGAGPVASMLSRWAPMLTLNAAFAGGGGGGGMTGTAEMPYAPFIDPMLALAAAGGGYAAGGGTGFAGLAPILGAPGGTAGYSRAAIGGSGGLLPSFGGGTAGKGLVGSLSHMSLSALRQNFFNSGSIATGSGTATTAEGIGGWQGTAAGIFTSQGAGALETSVGMPLATAGMFGSNRGTGIGILESTAGGALTGAGIGTMIMPGFGTVVGAAIGAGVGLGISAGETLAGIIAPWKKAQELVKQRYGVSIDHTTGQHIADLASSKYGGNVSVAVNSPDVRQMLQLYAAATGQKMPLSASQPHAGDLVEQGGKLYQQATSVYGNQFAYSSNLPILGGSNGVGIYPTPGGSSPPISLTLSVGGKGAGDFMAGSVVTPEFVQSQWSSAQSGSNGRLANSALIQAPGLITG